MSLDDLGVWSIDGAEILHMLNRVAESEEPGAVLAEAYASAEVSRG